MYNDNPTINNLNAKTVDEKRQGEALVLADNKKSTDKTFYIESYGCAMNFSDSEIVASILVKEGYSSSPVFTDADLILINTCSIREKAEHNVRQRLRVFDKNKEKKPGALVGVLGCMAERLKKKFLEEEKLVDMVVGPDAYRDLPKLIQDAEGGSKSVNVLLSREETYADISPVRLGSNGINAFISITRGCDNMCSFCVVPFTRGRERSREPFSIIAEAQDLVNKGYREVTLLGQNVDSYTWKHPQTEEVVTFAKLLEMTAQVDPRLRVRFSTSHPKDITDKVIHTIAAYPNICNYVHLPVQSGNSRILKMMNRTYDREWYMERVSKIYEVIPDCTISSDIISGFCSETEEEHLDTISIIKEAGFIMSYMFKYSERPGTLAAKKYEDDVPEKVKSRRLAEIVDVQLEMSGTSNELDLGQTFEVLIEGDSKKSDQDFRGRNQQNKMLIFPKQDGLKPGDYVYVKVKKTTTATLLGDIVKVCDTLNV